MAAPLTRAAIYFVSRAAPMSGQSAAKIAIGLALNRHQIDSRVLASSINLKVEFKLLALVNG